MTPVPDPAASPQSNFPWGGQVQYGSGLAADGQTAKRPPYLPDPNSMTSTQSSSAPVLASKKDSVTTGACPEASTNSTKTSPSSLLEASTSAKTDIDSKADSNAQGDSGPNIQVASAAPPPVVKTVSAPLNPPSRLPPDTLDPPEIRPCNASVRVVNSKRINLNFTVKDVGPSGVSGIDLWYTSDGRTWSKHESTEHHRSPYCIEVSDEGLYGFTLVAHNGAGASKAPPKPGDPPQMWVEVDTTKPVVHLVSAETHFESKNHTLAVRWTASDKNLGPRPITLAYADQAKGPWTAAATHLENTGRFVWTMPAGMPHGFYVRVEATDLGGNVSRAQTPTPVVLDRSQPSVSLVGVEPVKSSQ
jgi:hypothetical protein